MITHGITSVLAWNSMSGVCSHTTIVMMLWCNVSLATELYVQHHSLGGSPTKDYVPLVVSPFMDIGRYTLKVELMNC